RNMRFGGCAEISGITCAITGMAMSLCFSYFVCAVTVAGMFNGRTEGAFVRNGGFVVTWILAELVVDETIAAVKHGTGLSTLWTTNGSLIMLRISTVWLLTLSPIRWPK